MAKQKIKYLLDFIPLIILVLSAIILINIVITTDIILQWRHIAGLIILPINISLFFWRHKVGVLALCLTLLLGLVGAISFSDAIATTTAYIGNSEDFKLPIFHGQPIFLLWLLIHFIVSGRYYVGVVTKKYWQDFLLPLAKHL